MLLAREYSESKMGKMVTTEALQAARLACLDDLERYFGAPDGGTRISYRNEAAALSLILHRLKTIPGEHGTTILRERQVGVQALKTDVSNRN